MGTEHVYRPVRYFTAVFAATFLLWGIGAYLSFDDSLSSYFMLPMLLGLMAPSVIAVRMIWRTGNKVMRREFVTRIFDPRLIYPGKFSLALLIMPLSVLASIGLSVLLGGSAEQFEPAGTFSFSSGFVPVLIVLMIAAVFEELGWRGYGFESLNERVGFLQAAMLFGGLWSAWHLPLLFVQGSYQYEILQSNVWFAVNFYLSTAIMGVIISWVCVSNRKSILAAIVFHFVINISQEALNMTQEAKCIQTALLALVAVLIVLVERNVMLAGPSTGREAFT